MKTLICLAISTSLIGLFACSDSPAPEKIGPEIPAVVLPAGHSDLVIKNGMHYYLGNPFSGYTEEFHLENGALKSRVGYWQGRKSGEALKWYPDGQLYTRRFYHEGRKHGVHEGWWPDGKQQFRFHFVDGNYHGEVIEWHPNGQLATAYQYEEGRENGQQQAWRENGKLYVNYVVKDGRRYGMIKARLCYSVKDGEGQYVAKK